MVAMYFVGNSSTAKPLGVFTIFFFTADNYCTCMPNYHSLQEIQFSLLRQMVTVIKILVRQYLIFLLFSFVIPSHRRSLEWGGGMRDLRSEIINVYVTNNVH